MLFIYLTGQNRDLSRLKNIWPVIMTGELLSIILSLDRKFRKWEMREDKFENSIAKNQVYAIFHMRDTWNNVLHKFIMLYMEMPCWLPFEANKNIVGKNQQKHLSLSFSTKE